MPHRAKPAVLQARCPHRASRRAPRRSGIPHPDRDRSRSQRPRTRTSAQYFGQFSPSNALRTETVRAPFGIQSFGQLPSPLSTLLSPLFLLLLLLAACPTRAQNFPIEGGPYYGDWTCSLQSLILNRGYLDITNLTVCAGDPISAPILGEVSVAMAKSPARSHSTTPRTPITRKHSPSLTPRS